MTEQLPIEGLDMPAPAEPSPDYASWIDTVWPTYEAAAASGRAFTIYEVAKAADLPEPPDPAHQWGHLAVRLARSGLVRQDGWDMTRRPTANHSGVKTWVGIRTRLGGAA